MKNNEKESEEEIEPVSKEQEYLAGWQRARADLINVRRRAEQDREADKQRLRAQATESFLQVADHFRALTEHVPKELAGQAWVEGVLHIAREFERVLQEQGVEVLNPVGETFDPALHEAVEEVKGEKTNTVASVVQVGYRLGGVVLRPAKVKVTT